MDMDKAIDRLENCHPIIKEDEEVFKLAVDCMKFAKDFVPMNATPERMKHALNLLNSYEYILNNSDKYEEECNHNYELTNISYDGFNTVHTYKCSKCGNKKTMSMGI